MTLTRQGTAPAKLVAGSHRFAARTWLAWAAFPLLVVTLFLILVAANLNGSSIGMLHTTNDRDPALVAGAPRTIRSDEWVISTPIQVSAARQDFPRRPYIGLTPTLQHAIAHGGATRTWEEAFKPQDWGYLTLGAHRGLAVHWWFPFLVSLLGVFLLLRTLTLGAWLSGALAVVATMTPYNAWWSSPAPGSVLGYGTLTGAALILALRARRRLGGLAWGAAAGVAGTAMFLVLYPPWQVSVGLVIAGVVLGYALDRRVGWARLALAVGGTASVAVPALGGWYLANRSGVQATMDTFYPGARLSTAGQASLSWLLDAPLNPVLSGPIGTTVTTVRSGRPNTNLSEISASWLPLPVLAAAVLVTLAGWLRRSPVPSPEHSATGATGTAETGPVASDGRPAGRTAAAPGRWTVLGVAVALSVLLAWAVLPLPDWTGTLLLERVQGARLPLALGLGAVLLVGLVGTARRAARRPTWEHALWALAVVGTVAVTLWSAARMPWDADRVSGANVFTLAVLFAAGFGLVAAGYLPRVSATLLAAYAAWSWGLVNPLYHGLGPLDHDPVVRAMRAVAQADPGVRVEVFGDTRLVALVRASGVQSVSGVTLYPNEELMRQLDPSQRSEWNNYATYRWIAQPAGRPTSIRVVLGTSMKLHIDPCRPELLATGVRWVVSDTSLRAACLRPVDVVRSSKTRVAYRYQVID